MSICHTSRTGRRFTGLKGDRRRLETSTGRFRPRLATQSGGTLKRSPLEARACPFLGPISNSEQPGSSPRRRGRNDVSCPVDSVASPTRRVAPAAFIVIAAAYAVLVAQEFR